MPAAQPDQDQSHPAAKTQRARLPRDISAHAEQDSSLPTVPEAKAQQHVKFEAVNEPDLTPVGQRQPPELPDVTPSEQKQVHEGSPEPSFAVPKSEAGRARHPAGTPEPGHAQPASGERMTRSRSKRASAEASPAVSAGITDTCSALVQHRPRLEVY